MLRPNGIPAAPVGGVYEAWVARSDGPGNEEDQAKAVAIDGSGNVFVTGLTWGLGTLQDYATIKYNSAGQEQWVAYYNGPDNGDDQANAMAVDGSGNVYVTGFSGVTASYNDCTTIKYNSAGQELWVARHNVCPRGDAWGAGIAIDDLGNVYVTGGDGDGWVTIDYNTSGEEQWVAHHNEGIPTANGITVDQSGNVYVAGSRWRDPNYDCLTINTTRPDRNNGLPFTMGLRMTTTLSMRLPLTPQAMSM